MAFRKSLGLTTLFVVFSIAWTVMAQPLPIPEYCLMTFEEFAYEGPRDRNETRLPPRSPWFEHMSLSQDAKENDYHILDMEVVYQRENTTEIWLSAQQFFDTDITERIWVIYKPDSENTQYLAAELEIDERNYFITELFVDGNGDIWGSLELNRNLDSAITVEPSEAIYQPVLVYYNKMIRQFEVRDHIPAFPETQEFTMLFDNNTNFWLISDGGIISFDVSQTIDNQQFDFPELDHVRATMSSDNTIYIQNFFPVDSVVVNQFFPITGQLLPLPPLNQDWPAQNGLLVSNDGIVWLGASGYLSTNGKWQLLHTNVETHNQNVVHYAAASPFPKLESSDGKIWFESNFVDGYYNYVGTAWYDLQTSQGCMFTNLPSTVLEDDSSTIWLLAKEIVSGTLYSVNLGDL